MENNHDVSALDQLAIWAARWEHMRAVVLDLLGALNSPGEFTLDDWFDFNVVPMDDIFKKIMANFNITKEDVIEASNERDRANRAADEA